MFGGRGFDEQPTEESRPLDDLWLFNATSLWWTRVPVKRRQAVDAASTLRGVPRPRVGAASCGIDGLLFVVFGGLDFDSVALSDTWLFAIGRNTWYPLYQFLSNTQNPIAGSGHNQSSPAPIRPPPRHNAASWCLRDALVVFGGHGPANEILDDLWTFSLKSLEWTESNQYVSTLSPTGVGRHSLFPPGADFSGAWPGKDKLLYLYTHTDLGMQNSTPNHEMWTFSLETKSWIILASTIADYRENVSSHREPLKDRSQADVPSSRVHPVTWMDHSSGSLLLFGGQAITDDLKNRSAYSENLLADLWMFDTKLERWKRLDTTTVDSLPSARTGSIAWSHDSRTYIFGGLGVDARGRVGYLNDLLIQGMVDHSTMTDGRRYRNRTFATPALKTSVVEHKALSKTTAQLFVLETSTHERKIFPPLEVFCIVFLAVGGVSVLFCAAFCIKRIKDLPADSRHKKTYNVRYSPLNHEATFE